MPWWGQKEREFVQLSINLWYQKGMGIGHKQTTCGTKVNIEVHNSLQMIQFHPFFYDWVIPLCMYVHLLLYPLIWHCMFRWSPCPGYCKYCYGEHLRTWSDWIVVSSGLRFPWASLVTQTIKSLPEMCETRVQSLGWDPLEKEMATHSSILAWRIPWMENPGRLWSMGSQRVWYDWATNTLVICLVAGLLGHMVALFHFFMFSTVAVSIYIPNNLYPGLT